MFSAKSLTKMLCIPALLAAAPTASALMTPTPDPAHLREEALQAAVREAFGPDARFPFWNHLGHVNQSTGIYLGSARVLTAAHVGPGTFTFRDGRSYAAVPGSETHFRGRSGSRADLCVYRIRVDRDDPVLALAAVPLSRTAPVRGRRVLLVGAGGGNAGATQEVRDFRWNQDFRLRWGLNEVAFTFSKPIRTHGFSTPGYSTLFAEGPRESQACPGDSGGGVFVWLPEARRWELAGVILAVDGNHGGARFGDQTYIGDTTILPRRELGAPGIIATR
jgi:hypothetical protein